MEPSSSSVGPSSRRGMMSNESLKKMDSKGEASAPIPPKTTPSKDIKIVANEDFKQKQSVTDRPSQVPVEDKDQVQEMPADADPEQEELMRLWETLKDDEERILMWNNHVNSWCWRKYVRK